MARRARRERMTEAFDAFHAAMGAVLGAAENLGGAAARAHAETMAEMWLRDVGIDAARVDPGLADVLTNPALADAVERVARDRDIAFAGWCDGDDSGPRRLDGLVAETAPRSAGKADGWLTVGKAELHDPVPQLWRIGTGTVGVGCGEFPVALPLLDTAHLEITGPAETRAAAEAMVESLLMRVVGYFRPGLVQLHVWDVGQFTGSLPGLYPLTSTGLLTVHDPGSLAGLLDELSDRIRRVHTRVLVGGLPSLAEQARQGGDPHRAVGRGGAAGQPQGAGRGRPAPAPARPARRSGVRDLGRTGRRAADDRRGGRDRPARARPPNRDGWWRPRR